VVVLGFSCGSEPSFLTKTSTSSTTQGTGGTNASAPSADDTAGNTVGAGPTAGSVGSVPGSDSTAGDQAGHDGSSPGSSGSTTAGGSSSSGGTSGSMTPGSTGTGSASGGSPGKTPGGTPASGGTGTVPPNIPAADPSDLDALGKCLAQWPQNPFTGVIQNYEKIDAVVTVGGLGNAINDTDTTPEPELVLVDAGVNVLGSPVYNLLNNNGWYCIKVNVNVATNLTVNLSCSAHLADERVNVNVLSNQNQATSTVGVSVLSDVQVVTVRPEGDTCIR
jgi:hypothetical protein